MNDDDTTRTLRLLDSAPEDELDPAARRRAEAGRDRILTTSPGEHGVSPNRSVRRWILSAGSLAAATVAGLVVVAALTPTPAYASWTPVSTSLNESEETIAGSACTEAGQRPDAEVVLAERRGDWVAVAAVTDDPGTVQCLLHLPPGATHADHVRAGSTGGQGAVPVGGDFTGPAMAQFFETGFLGIGSAPAVAIILGDVGPDVSAVDITTPEGTVVAATVDDGRYIAWWPGSAFSEDGSSVAPLQYRITTTDGSVTENARPVLPE